MAITHDALDLLLIEDYRKFTGSPNIPYGMDVRNITDLLTYQLHKRIYLELQAIRAELVKLNGPAELTLDPAPAATSSAGPTPATPAADRLGRAVAGARPRS